MPWIWNKLHICKIKGHEISKRCVLFWSRDPDGYRKNDRKRAVVWPWLVVELSTVLALTQLWIRQSDWRRAGIRSTNLHIVVEYTVQYNFNVLKHDITLSLLAMIYPKTHVSYHIIKYTKNWMMTIQMISKIIVKQKIVAYWSQFTMQCINTLGWQWAGSSLVQVIASRIASFNGPTWGPSGSDRTQVGPMLAPWIC